MIECRLCKLECKTYWYYEDMDWVVCDCLTCGTDNPMIVRRKHGFKEDAGDFDAAWKICKELFGEKFVGFRKKMRSIKGHLHWHILLKVIKEDA